jgi:hypothetical protein
MSFIKTAMLDNKTGKPSSTRLIAVVAGLTLSACTAALTVASFWVIELVPALTVFGGALAGLAGANYVAQRAWSDR